MEKEINHDPLTYKIIGSAIEVHKEMGPGFLEAVYEECLEIEFNKRKIPYIMHPILKIFYKGSELKKYYIPDFLIFKEIIVEIKSERCLTKIDEAQTINSLKGSGKRIAVRQNNDPGSAFLVTHPPDYLQYSPF
jgi:GxxExxY protein